MWLASAGLLWHGINVGPRVELNTGVRWLGSESTPGALTLATEEWVCKKAGMSLGIRQQSVKPIFAAMGADLDHVKR
jgi:hypothetical protein